MNPRFLSDNTAGVHPAVMEALMEANTAPALPYGNDQISRRVSMQLQSLFGETIVPFLVYNGTAANVAALAALTAPYQAVICTSMAHINVHECGAPEKFTGCKLLCIDAPDGKLNPETAAHALVGINDEHYAQPAVLSITESTEAGTVYTPEEITALTAWAHNNNLKVHMDGARLANAAAALGVGLSAITSECGVDAWTFGGTKNGLMFGEALFFADPSDAENFKYIRKQSLQLNSKMRFSAAQFEAYCTDNLWKECAEQANRMALYLGDALFAIPGVELVHPIEVNSVFVRIPAQVIDKLRNDFAFHLWDENDSIIRLMCGFDTTDDHIHQFADTLKAHIHG